MSLITQYEVNEFLRAEDFREWRSGFREHLILNGLSAERADKIVSLSERAFQSALAAVRRIAATSKNQHQSEAVELDALNLLAAVARGLNKTMVDVAGGETLQ